MAEKHRDSGAVGARVEHLLRHVIIGIDRYRGASHEGGLVGHDVVRPQLHGRCESGEQEKCLRVVAAALEAVGGADARELDVAHEGAVGAVHADQRLRVLQILGNEMTAHVRDVLEGLLGLGDELVPARRRRVGDIDRDHA